MFLSKKELKDLRLQLFLQKPVYFLFMLLGHIPVVSLSIKYGEKSQTTKLRHIKFAALGEVLVC